VAEPRRIQRKRVKGWRLPFGAVYVGRPSMWGNPWCAGELRGTLPPMTAGQAVARYEQWLASTVSQPPHGAARAHILMCLYQLRGRDLACWCKLTDPCHADVLLAVANSQED